MGRSACGAGEMIAERGTEDAFHLDQGIGVAIGVGGSAGNKIDDHAAP